MKKLSIPKAAKILHGADYNPDQWLSTPEIWDEDMRLMKLAACNSMSVGIFSWSALEPKEGQFEFGWLDAIMDKLAQNGMFIVLATPSGSRPQWLAQKYPEVLRVGESRVRNLFGRRHNHCYTSPVYREKVGIINGKLAERYKNHPALILWHVSNEYSGECHCPLCQEAFRDWLKIRYNNDLKSLNDAWWMAFWSHTYTDWAQIESPAPHGVSSVHGLKLDWKRFVTHQTMDFIKVETAPLRKYTPDIPVTTNFVGALYYDWLDHSKMKDVLDVISWDCYPMWQNGTIDETACMTAFTHDYKRALKDKPFLMLESTPSTMLDNRQKRPGQHILSSIQATAHGSDSVMYFQWRKSRGSVEKFHGAVVDHCGHEHTRVFKEVAQLGEILGKMDEVAGTYTAAEVGLIFDRENCWALDDKPGLPKRSDYEAVCLAHYRPFWENGVLVDVIDSEHNFDQYKLLVAPMLYMIKPGVAERLNNFVQKGGVLVTTFWSGQVDEHDLCFLGGFPGPLKDLFGVWAEEIDTLKDNEVNQVRAGGKEYTVNTFCEIIHAKGAEILGEYTSDYYKGSPALTVNAYGSGKAYYVAFGDGGDFLTDFYANLIEQISLSRALDCDLPQGVSAVKRGKHVFLMNFVGSTAQITLNQSYVDIISNDILNGTVELAPWGVRILRCKERSCNE